MQILSYWEKGTGYEEEKVRSLQLFRARRWAH